MNSVNFGYFVLSQTLYSIGTFAIMSALFQLKFKRYMMTISVVSFLNSVINYLIYFHKYGDMGYIVPIISVLVTFLYLAAVVKIPMFWSLVVTVTGSLIVPIVIQLGIVFCSFGFFAPDALKEYIWRNYALDTASGLIYCLIASILYFRGWGFMFDFEKIHFKWERYIIISFTCCATLFFPTTIIFTHINDFTLSLSFLAISSFLVFIFLLGYAIKKEKDEIKFMKNK